MVQAAKTCASLSSCGESPAAGLMKQFCWRDDDSPRRDPPKKPFDVLPCQTRNSVFGFNKMAKFSCFGS